MDVTTSQIDIKLSFATFRVKNGLSPSTVH